MSAVYGFAAAALLVGCAGARLFARLAPRAWRGVMSSRWIAALIAGLACLPLFAGDSAAMWLHGAIGPLSLTSTQLLLLAALYRTPPRLPSAALAIGIAAALVFYPLALGYSTFDPYGAGYCGFWPLLLALAVAVWLWYGRQYTWLLIVGIDLAAYGVGLFANLWNALFDPLLLVVAAVALFRRRRRP